LSNAVALPTQAEESKGATVQAAPIVVTATRDERSSFDLPVSIDVVPASAISEAQPMLNASESLARVPGLVAPNTYRLSSDQQLSSRGFGARAGFGIRGIRIYADGIPQSMPDGQGQTGTFNLSSAERIEVMRGPYSALYGNSSGGVVSLFTRNAPAQPTVAASYYAGSFDTWRAGLQYAGNSGGLDTVVDASRYETDGYRDHSAAQRDQANVKLSTRLSERDKLTVVASYLDQPYNDDPQGLTRALMEANPQQTIASSITFNTGGYKNQTHAGVNWEHQFNADNKLQTVVYAGQRNALTRLSIPVFVQSADAHSGGTSLVEREFAGGDVRLAHSSRFGGGRMTVTGGLNYETMDDARKGYMNNNGVQGALKRDENNIARNFDQYLQAEWQSGGGWVFSGGLRHSEVRIESQDHFIATGNPDDSGEVTFTNTSPVLGVLYHLSPTVNLYANAGRGFETPTLIELAYTNTGAGLNFALQPSRSKNFEVGMKSFIGTATSLNVAAFKITTENEIVVDAGGARSTFKNAAKTSRDGIELALASTLAPNLDATLSYALLNATFDETFTSSSGTVAAGNRIPGAPKTTAYAELAWKLPSFGLSTALEARYTGEIKVDDINSDAAEASTVVNWRIALEQKFGALTLQEFGRIENLSDEQYVGGVIVNDTTNKRYFAPAPGRNYLFGASLAMAF
jgi:iron complex outermembrane receptor protein